MLLHMAHNNVSATCQHLKRNAPSEHHGTGQHAIQTACFRSQGQRAVVPQFGSLSYLRTLRDFDATVGTPASGGSERLAPSRELPHFCVYPSSSSSWVSVHFCVRNIEGFTDLLPPLPAWHIVVQIHLVHILVFPRIFLIREIGRIPHRFQLLVVVNDPTTTR
ncbi:hypothetical protein BJV78DRAFT_625322 [Lactifluus subvellereus]|nr:hypothetical protein BJV78DRAFT_625322 [Lactifluus subvellereus]